MFIEISVTKSGEQLIRGQLFSKTEEAVAAGGQGRV